MNNEAQTQNAQIEQFIPESTRAAHEQAAQAASQQAKPVIEAAPAPIDQAAADAAMQTTPAAAQSADAASQGANAFQIASPSHSPIPADMQPADVGGGWAESTAQFVADFMNVCYEFLVEFCKFVKILFSQEHSWEIFGVIVAALFLIFFARKIWKKFRPVRLFNNSAGVVEVSRKALNELAESVCYGMGAMNKPDVEIYTRRRRLCIRVALALEAGQSLAEISYKLQNALTIAFREHLGVEKLGNIDVKILAFKGLVHKPLYRQIAASDVIPTESSVALRRERAEKIDDFQVENHKD